MSEQPHHAAGEQETGSAAPRLVLPPPPVRAEPRRLHPAVMGVWPLSQAGPLVLLLVAGAVSGFLVVAVLAVSAVTSAVRYHRFRWKVEPDALVIEQGLLQRQRRVIPRERIQTVDVVRKLRHRLFGVVEVRVEAIGGDSTEGRLDALSPGDARWLRAELLRAHDTAPSASGPTPEPDGEALVRMRPADLIGAGMTGGRVGVAAALLGFAQQLFGDRMDELLRRAPALIGGLRGLAVVVTIALVGAFVLSIAATVLRYWDFTLARDGDTLRVRRGLLEQRLDTVPLRRVQAIRVEENLVRRWLGKAVVQVDVAGQAGGEGGRDTGLLLPFGSRGQAFALVAAILERDDVVDVALEPAPRRARERRLLRAGLFTGAATVAAGAAFGWIGLSALALAVPTAAAALAAYHALGHARLDGLVVTRVGVTVRRTVFVPTAKLQSLALVSSPPQRWRRLRTLDLQIARSPGVWGGPQIVDVDATLGARLLADLADASTVTARKAA